MTRTLLRHRWRLFRRRSGNPLTLLLGAAVIWATHHLAGRAADAWPAGPEATLLAALLLLALLAGGLGWRRVYGAEQENDFSLLQPIPGRALGQVWLIELTGALLLPVLALAAGLWRLFADPLVALGPLAWLPGLAGLSIAGPLAPALAAPSAALMLLALVGPLPALGGAAVASLLPARATGLMADRWRARYAGRRRVGRVRQRPAGRILHLLLAPLPRVVRALVQADLLFLLRGGFLRGRVVLALLLLVTPLYLVWPLPPGQAHAPLIVGAMLLTFALAGVGFVIGGDMAAAELPYLPVKRLAPISGSSIWWARQLLALAVGLIHLALLVAALLLRHGPDALALLPPMAAVTIVVTSYTVAFGLAVAGQADLSSASSVAIGGVVMAVVTLAVFNWQPLVLLAYPLLLVRLYGRGVGRFRTMPVG